MFQNILKVAIGVALVLITLVITHQILFWMGEDFKLQDITTDPLAVLVDAFIGGALVFVGWQTWKVNHYQSLEGRRSFILSHYSRLKSFVGVIEARHKLSDIDFKYPFILKEGLTLEDFKTIYALDGEAYILGLEDVGKWTSALMKRVDELVKLDGEYKKIIKEEPHNFSDKLREAAGLDGHAVRLSKVEGKISFAYQDLYAWLLSYKYQLEQRYKKYL